MKKNKTKNKRAKQKTQQNVDPVKVCISSLNAYLTSYLSALNAAGVRR